jgi:hypothetical protein
VQLLVNTEMDSVIRKSVVIEGEKKNLNKSLN